MIKILAKSRENLVEDSTEDGRRIFVARMWLSAANLLSYFIRLSEEIT